MPRLHWKPTEKQAQALDCLRDGTTTELFYGGAAGGGKSHLGCAWLIHSCMRYPGSRWLMGRAVLKNLKASTLLTFFDICKTFGMKAEEHFTYNQVESTVKFFNGSEIYLKDLFAYPSDPEFDSLGSTEFTGAFIDEGSQITNKAKNIVTSRIRYKLEHFGLIPKLLIASNPSKNFLYYEFYKPWKEGTLPSHRQFIPALVWDNPYISPHYVESLRRLDKVSRERLLEGNFEYDDDPAKLMEYDAITDIFTNQPPKSEERYMTVDVARFGQDKIVIILWHGLLASRIIMRSKQATDATARDIERYAAEDGVRRGHIAVDEDGVGGGVVDMLRGVRGFLNNGKPTEGNYANLKSQCYFKLADLVNAGKIGICRDIDAKVRELIIEDLEQVKRKDIDKDGKLAVIPKEQVKETLGRSPDLSDALMMRMLFELERKDTPTMVGWISPRENNLDFSAARRL